MRRLVILAAVFAAFAVSWGDTRAQATNDTRLVAYYMSYDIYDEQYFVTDIPGQLLTHLNYGYIDISDNLQCESADEWADTGFAYPGDRQTERVRGNFKQLQLLREQYPDLQILMSIGGWEHSANFSDAALTEESRVRLARSCLAFMREYGFDGIDIDWRYPVVGGTANETARPEDSANLTLLMADFRGQIEYWSEQDDRRYLLTMAVSGSESLYSSVQLNLVQEDVDWFNLMSFGFYGSWSPITSHFAGLYRNPRDPESAEAYTVDAAVNSFLDAGVPAQKIVLGIPFYAQTWRNVRPNDYFGLFQPTDGVPSGTRAGGTLYYQDLEAFLSSPAYVRFFDDEAKAAWMYNADRRIAISYENEASILLKMAYVRNMGLGGTVAWELAFDDDAHSLLRAAHEGLTGS